MTKDEMTNEELALLIKEGHTEYIITLWERVVKLIRIIAYAWKRRRPDNTVVDAEDLVQSGYFAMLKAVEAYDPDTGFAFTTYLHFPLKAAFQEAFGIKTSRQRYNAQQTVISLNAPVGTDEDSSPLEDMLADPTSEVPFEQIERTDEQRMMREMLEDAAARLLNPRQRELLSKLLNTDCSLTEIAVAANTTIKRASKIKQDLFWKLKTDAQMQKLCEYMRNPDAALASSSARAVGVSSFRDTGLSVVERLAFQRMDQEKATQKLVALLTPDAKNESDILT